MRLVATGAALFFWMQVSLCGLEGMGVARFDPPHDGALARASQPMASAPAHGAGGGAPQGAHHGPRGHHAPSGPASPDAPDHCSLIAQALGSTSPALDEPGAAALAVQLPNWTAEPRAVAVVLHERHRAPPRQSDLYLRHASFLL